MTISSVESQKGVTTIQECSIENKNGAITAQSLWHFCPSDSQRTLLNNDLMPFWLSTDGMEN